VKEILLANGFVALIDDQDYDVISKHRWSLNSDGYARCAVRDPDRPGKQMQLKMHRAVMGLSRGDRLEVDHIDGNKLNNQRANLRICDRTGNNRNVRKRSDNTSGFKGVSRTASNRWRATITIAGKNISLGTFEAPEEAHAAYCRAATLKHGEFANLG